MEQTEQKFSYSKIETYRKCPFKYKLTYVDNHYIESRSVATDFGTLVHYIEEQIGLDFKNNKKIDYERYKNLFLNIDLQTEEETVQGASILKEIYKDDWNTPNKQRFSYEDKTNEYLSSGIYLLKNILEDNSNFKIYAAELPFEVEIQGNLFRGFIDRVYYNEEENTYIIEDIKTYTKRLSPKELRESLQMYIYSVALRNIVGEDINIKCFYNLPLINDLQRCILNEELIEASLQQTLLSVEQEEFRPKPTPLCHWCVFSKTFPNQPEEAKNLCPYFCRWTRETRDMTTENTWQGESLHEVILENFKKENKI